MTGEEKKKKAVAVAVAYYLEKERTEKLSMAAGNANSWSRTGQKMGMNKRNVIQSRGKFLR